MDSEDSSANWRFTMKAAVIHLRWYILLPEMKRFIFGDRGGIHIIDLQQSLTRIEGAYGYVRDLVANGGTVLFIGTIQGLVMQSLLAGKVSRIRRDAPGVFAIYRRGIESTK